MKKEFGESSLLFSFLDKSIKINSRDTIWQQLHALSSSAQFPEERTNLGRGTETQRHRDRDRDREKEIQNFSDLIFSCLPSLRMSNSHQQQSPTAPVVNNAPDDRRSETT
jgi:hypothetical protein